LIFLKLLIRSLHTSFFVSECEEVEDEADEGIAFVLLVSLLLIEELLNNLCCVEVFAALLVLAVCEQEMPLLLRDN